MKILVEQEGIDINDKTNVYFNNLILRNNIWNFFNKPNISQIFLIMPLIQQEEIILLKVEFDKTACIVNLHIHQKFLA